VPIVSAHCRSLSTGAVTMTTKSPPRAYITELSMGGVDPWVGFGWVGSGRVTLNGPMDDSVLAARAVRGRAANTFSARLAASSNVEPKS